MEVAEVVRRVKYHQLVSRVLRGDTVSSHIPLGVLVGTLRGRARIFGRYVCVSCMRLVSHTRAAGAGGREISILMHSAAAAAQPAWY